MESFEDDFDEAAGLRAGNQPLELHLIELLDRLHHRPDLSHTHFDMSNIYVAGFYLNTVLPLEREAYDFTCCATHLNALVESKNVIDLCGKTTLGLLAAKAEEVLHKGLKLFPDSLPIQLCLAKTLIDKIEKSGNLNFDEPVNLLNHVIISTQPEPETLNEDYEKAKELLAEIRWIKNKKPYEIGSVPY